MMVCYFWMDFVWYLLEYKKNSVGCERHGKKKHIILCFFCTQKRPILDSKTYLPFVAYGKAFVNYQRADISSEISECSPIWDIIKGIDQGLQN